MQSAFDYFQGSFQVPARVSEAQKAGFKLRGREIDPLLQATMEEFPERLQVGLHRLGRAPDGFPGKKETEHRADPMKLIRFTGIAQQLAHGCFQLLADTLEFGESFAAFKFS